jgi:hypothetical protein
VEDGLPHGRLQGKKVDAAGHAAALARGRKGWGILEAPVHDIGTPNWYSSRRQSAQFESFGPLFQFELIIAKEFYWKVKGRKYIKAITFRYIESRTRINYGKDTTINAVLAVRNTGNLSQNSTNFSQFWPPSIPR